MPTDLGAIAEQRGIRYFLISFTDLLGVQRAKLVPASPSTAWPRRRRLRRLRHLARHDAGRSRPVRHARSRQPDPAAVEARGRLARRRSWMNGQPVDHAPRNVLKRLVATAAERGCEMKTGVECEFFLISPDGAEISDAADRQGKPCYDQQALMRRYDVIAEICDAMQALGWQPYQNDHEDANGQFEMNWQYDDSADHRRPPFLLQVHGALDRREAWPARHLHAQAVPRADRQRLPRPCLAVAGRPEPVRRCRRASSACRRWATSSWAASCTRPRRSRRCSIRRSTPTSASMRRRRCRARAGRRAR